MNAKYVGLTNVLRLGRKSILVLLSAAAMLTLGECRQSYLHKSKYAQADVLTIALALSHYRAEHGTYLTFRSGKADELERFLVPKYIKSIPDSDPWGHPYNVEITPSSYAVWSNGADGQRDARWEISRTVGEECDIVIENGKYIQYPQGIGTPGMEWEHPHPIVREGCTASTMSAIPAVRRWAAAQLGVAPDAAGFVARRFRAS